MNRKYSLKFFLIGLFLHFTAVHFYLFLPGIILSIIGIWNEECLAVGLAMLVVDLVMSCIEQLRIRKIALQESDHEEFNQLMDAALDPNSPKTLAQIIKEKPPLNSPQEDDRQALLQKLAVYRALKESIHDGMTLDEMMNAFQKMCAIPVGDPDDLLFETGTYRFTDEKQFVFSLVRQFRFLDQNEYVQLRLEINYAPCFQTALLYYVKWGSVTDGNFFSMVRKSLAYKAVRNMPITFVDVRIEET